MGRHSGDAVEQPPSPDLRKRLLTLALGLTATLIAWGFLVWAAIDFGNQARDGEAAAWVFLIFATLGATACLFSFLILVNKMLATLRGEAPPPSSGPPGGKRAAR